MDIRIVKLNNKSRKGLYVYVKETNQRASYYKYSQNDPLDVYSQYYQSKYINQDLEQKSLPSFRKFFYANLSSTKHMSLPKNSAERYISSLKKLPSISRSFKKGITEYSFSKAHLFSNSGLMSIRKKILSPLVINPELVFLLAKEENFKKMKSRLEFEIKFKNERGEVLAVTKVFNKTPRDVASKLREVNFIGTTVDSSEAEYGEDTIFKRKVNFTGFLSPDIVNAGVIQNYSVKATFRKG